MRAEAGQLAEVVGPVLETVGKPKGSAEEFLRAIRDQSGLLTGWDQDSYGFMHLGFQEYLAAGEIRRRAFSEPSVLKELASRFGQSWWLEVTLLLLAMDDPCPFPQFMAEVMKRPEFAEHPDLVDMCIEDAAEVSMGPFVSLLKTEPGEDRGLWECQFAALRVLARQDESAVEALQSRLSKHPYGKIRRHSFPRSSVGTHIGTLRRPVERTAYLCPVFPHSSARMRSRKRLLKMWFPDTGRGSVFQAFPRRSVGTSQRVNDEPLREFPPVSSFFSFPRSSVGTFCRRSASTNSHPGISILSYRRQRIAGRMKDMHRARLGQDAKRPKSVPARSVETSQRVTRCIFTRLNFRAEILLEQKLASTYDCIDMY